MAIYPAMSTAEVHMPATPSAEALPSAGSSGRHFTQAQLWQVANTAGAFPRLCRCGLAESIWERNSHERNNAGCVRGILAVGESHGLCKLPERPVAAAPSGAAIHSSIGEKKPKRPFESCAQKPSGRREQQRRPEEASSMSEYLHAPSHGRT